MKTARFAFPVLLLGSATLSLGPVLVRLADVGPVQSAFWRLAIAAPLLLALARLTGGDAPGRRFGGKFRWLVGAGFFFAADLTAWHVGITRTTLANSTLFGNAAAFLFPLLGYAVARRWPSRLAALALALAATGLGLLMGKSAGVSAAHLSGDVLCLLAALFYTGYLFVMDRARGDLSALGALAPVTLLGAAFLLPAALLAPGNFWPHDWTAPLLLALGSQVLGQGMLIYGLPHLPPVASGVGLLVQPALSALIGFLWFGEVLGPVDFVGMASIFAAIVLVRWPSAARPAVEKRVPPSPDGALPPGPRADEPA